MKRKPREKKPKRRKPRPKASGSLVAKEVKTELEYAAAELEVKAEEVKTELEYAAVEAEALAALEHLGDKKMRTEQRSAKLRWFVSDVTWLSLIGLPLLLAFFLLLLLFLLVLTCTSSSLGVSVLAFCVLCLLIAVGFMLITQLSGSWELPRPIEELGSETKCKSAFRRIMRMDNPVAIFLKVLLSAPPKGTGNEWDGNQARRLAANGLGQLKDRVAVGPLLEALDDPDAELRERAVRALGRIGDVRAAPAVIPLLGEVETAADAVGKLVGKELVEALLAVLRGDKAGVEKLREKSQPEVIEGLIKAVDRPDASKAANAAWALGELRAEVALAKLRSMASVFSSAPEELKRACAEAIGKLEPLAALPRSTEAPIPTVDALPAPAEEPIPTVDTLPAPEEGNAVLRDEAGSE